MTPERGGKVGIAVLAASVAAIGIVVVLGRQPSPNAALATGGPTTLALYAGPPKDSSAPPTTAPGTGTTPRAAATPAVARPPAADPLVCVKSFDPVCGDLYWDPPLGPNTPISLAVVIEPSSPAVGQLVTITVTWSDLEADFSIASIETPLGCEVLPEGRCVNVRVLPATDAGCPEPHGPWAPPASAPSGGSQRFFRAYAEPGVYTWTVTVYAAASTVRNGCDPDPWTEKLERRGTIAVRPAPPTTSSSTTVARTSTSVTPSTTTSRP